MIKLPIILAPRHLVGGSPKSSVGIHVHCLFRQNWGWGSGTGGRGGDGGEVVRVIGRRPLTQKCHTWWPNYFLGQAVPILDCSE